MIPRILAISPSRTGPWLNALSELRDAGVSALMLRLIHTPDALEVALSAAQCAGLQILVRPVLAGDAELALAAGAGLHLPDRDPPTRSRAGLTSTSCHDATRVASAAAAGLDLCTLAPVFAPGSKPHDTRTPLGLAGLRAATAAAPGFPVLALGGIQPAGVPAVMAAGAHGVAGITGFFDGLRVDRSGAAAIARKVEAHGRVVR